jgi:hypothetical protein
MFIAFLCLVRYNGSTPNPLRKGAFPVPPLYNGVLGGVVFVPHFLEKRYNKDEIYLLNLPQKIRISYN